MSQIGWVVLALILAVLLDILIIHIWRRYKQLRQEYDNQEPLPTRWQTLKQAIRIETKDGILKKTFDLTVRNVKFRQGLKIVIEFTIIALWAVWIGREYLNFDPRVIPAGREFGSAIQTHHLWTMFQKCGLCSLWNGSERGGYPAFADIHGSMLHPVVMVTTLLWGVLKGAKISLVISFWVGGIAQWWIARALKLGLVPRLWSAGMAVVGGHLAGRMELGVFGVVLSTAMCSLVFGGILALARGGGRRAAVILGVVIGLALVSGQGYIQVGLFGILPGMVFLIFDEDYRLLPIWKEYVLALGLGLLLASPFIIPFIHFVPNFVKYVDPNFSTAQSLTYLPLNLVINDWEYYTTEILDKLPFPHLYSLYIGWIPVILAFIGLGKVKSGDRRILWFMVTGIIFVFLIASSVILKWFTPIIPQIGGIRHPSQIAGLAVPLILGLSAYGLEYLFNLSWPTLWMGFSEKLKDRRFQFSLHWLLLIPLILSLRSGYAFTKFWIHTYKPSEKIQELLEELKTDTAQWVNPPFGEHYYIEPAVNLGLKLSPGIMTFQWKDRELPVPMLEANRKGPPPGPVEKIAEVDGIPIFERLDQPYAAVYGKGMLQPCQARASGGYIDVYCNSTVSGTLVVKENTWSGWYVWIDRSRVQLVGMEWLEVDAPAGKHIYQFRYQPWDVYLGLVVSLIGVVLSVHIWRASPKDEVEAL